ncbi:hypothetical protein ABZX85_33630 [Streptomyces sp. NPDC004539]|uniref:hypothetical protein n=1 Tax=Streptomyces sp. NPDC004539 TaxID=3154280 RepID=UPI0033AB0976
MTTRSGLRTRILCTALILAAVPAVATASGEDERVQVCLVPSGAPTVEHPSRLPAAAVPALLRTTPSYAGPCAAYGPAVRLGDGTLRAYTRQVAGRPVAVGVVFPASALRGLPTAVSDGRHCFDADGDGRTDLHTECSVGHEYALEPPGAGQAPFVWDLVNWNPAGHNPQGVYDTPHFDFHFYLQPKSARDAIRTGPCQSHMNCEDYARARRPVPARYTAPGFADLDAVEPAMGNHLLDTRSPELNGGPFTHTWIYGAYDGEITFYEAMVAKSWLEGQRDGRVEDTCTSFRQPRAWRESGWYPTRYCTEYRENRREHVVSLEGFVFREAS